MSSSASSNRSTPTGEHAPPTSRDLDRLASVLRSVGAERSFPNRVVDRYRQWIFLFIGWCLKVPPGTVARHRIGDFWAALSEHPGAGKAKVCEAMDALGFFFGGVLRETDVLPFAEADPTSGTDTADTEGVTENQYMRPNPVLRASDPDARPSAPLSDRERSRHLPEGELPESVDARATIPTREMDRTDADEATRTSSQEARAEASPEADAPGGASAEERRSREAPTTLFNPEGTTPPPEWSSAGREVDDKGAVPDDENDAESEPACPVPAVGAETTDDPSSDLGPNPSGDTAPTPLTGHGDEASEESPETVPVEIPRPVADRLRRMAQRLGLPPSVCAARAIEMVCEDAGVERSQSPSVEAPLKHYQAQLDLLRLQKEESEPPLPDLPTGEDVSPGPAPQGS